jgi:hypothetical protein
MRSVGLLPEHDGVAGRVHFLRGGTPRRAFSPAIQEFGTNTRFRRWNCRSLFMVSRAFRAQRFSRDAGGLVRPSAASRGLRPDMIPGLWCEDPGDSRAAIRTPVVI